MKANNSMDNHYVIPAKAGIQLIGRCLRSGSVLGFCPLRGVMLSLDSRLPPAFARVTGNDGCMGKPG